MKRQFIITMMLTAIMMFACQNVKAADNNGWPANYGGVMLQAFYWNSYSDTKWTNLIQKCSASVGELRPYLDSPKW